MRLAFAAAVVALSLVIPVRAHAQTSIDGFGALPMNQLSSLGDSGVPFDFGGRLGFEVVPGVQLMGEFGRLGNVMPAFIDAGLAFTRVDLKVSAFYGEGGVRLLAAPRSSVSPYVEGSAGIAHLRFGINGLGSTTDAIVRAALNIVDTRDPIVGAGGGILLHGFAYLQHSAEHWAELVGTLPGVGAVLGPIAMMLLNLLTGLVAGAIVVGIVSLVRRFVPSRSGAPEG